MKRWACVLAGVLWSAPAMAQSMYVAGALAGEFVLTTSTEAGGSTIEGGNGQALAGAIRVGTHVTPRIGVELELFRPGRIETNTNGPIYLADAGVRQYPSFTTVGDLVPDLGLPSIIGQKTRVRTTTISTLAFVRQSLGSRVDLIYLGGVGFSRVVHDLEYGFPRVMLPGAPQIAPSFSTRTTQYGVGPVVGVEGRIGMTEHMRLVAGLRIHALDDSLIDGWLIRPSVGLAWMF
jgi:hypothetical protein